jgi:hypothetical protein
LHESIFGSGEGADTVLRTYVARSRPYLKRPLESISRVWFSGVADPEVIVPGAMFVVRCKTERGAQPVYAGAGEIQSTMPADLTHSWRR